MSGFEGFAGGALARVGNAAYGAAAVGSVLAYDTAKIVEYMARVDSAAAAVAPKPAMSKADVYKAQSGPLTLINCSGKAMMVKTFNSNDGTMWVPFETKAIGYGAISQLRCATTSCKLDLGSKKTAALSGFQVYIQGDVKATNKSAMDAGCGVF